MLDASRTRGIAVVSIGSASISVGIAEHSGREGYAIVAAERLALPLQERTPEQTIATVKQRLADGGHRVLAAGAGGRAPRRITSVHAVIRAPWAQSRTLRADIQYKRDEYIREAIITDLAQRALKDTHVPAANFLEASVMQVALNGYVTSEPAGKYAHKVEIATLVCVADPALREALRSALAAVFPSAPVSIHCAARGILESVREAHPEQPDCLVLDVSEEGTAAIVVREGTYGSEAYIAEGMRAMFSRALPGNPPEETFASIRMIARGQCDPATCNKVEEALAKMEPDFAHAFGEFFASMTTPRRLPNVMILLVHPDIAPWFVRFFSRIDFAQFTEVSQPFEVTLLKDRTAGPPGPAAAQAGVGDSELEIALALINKRGERDGQR